MSSKAKALIGLVVASIFWASSGVAAKTLLKTFDPITVGAIRLTIASITILPFFLQHTKKFSWKLFRDVFPVSLVTAANFIIFLFGIKLTTANASGMIYTGTPLLAAILAALFIGERISKRKIVGILVGLIGVLIILLLPVFEGHALPVGDLTGNLMIVGAMTAFALYNVGSRRLINKHYHPLTITGFSLMTSAAAFWTLWLLFPHTPLQPIVETPSLLMIAVYMGIMVTTVPYVLHQWAVKHSSATTASLTTYIQPVFGFIFNGIFLGEILSGGFLVGTTLVFIGVTLVTGVYKLRKVN